MPDLPPNTRLTRGSAAQALTAHGFPIATATLRTMASRGGGPPYRTFGRTALYTWADTLAWAEARLTAPRRSTSEADTQRAAGPDASGQPSRSPGAK
jgi:hypothetical protein